MQSEMFRISMRLPRFLLFPCRCRASSGPNAGARRQFRDPLAWSCWCAGGCPTKSQTSLWHCDCEICGCSTSTKMNSVNSHEVAIRTVVKVGLATCHICMYLCVYIYIYIHRFIMIFHDLSWSFSGYLHLKAVNFVHQSLSIHPSTDLCLVSIP